MQVRQKNIRIFEIVLNSDSENLIDYINKNYPLVKDNIFLIKGDISKELVEFLNKQNICFVDMNSFENYEKIVSKGKEITKNEKEIKIITAHEIKDDTVETKKVFNRTIRSGEEINTDYDIVVFGRVNNGSKIISKGNVEIFGNVEGMVICDGSYMILKSVKSDNIFFNGENIDKNSFDGKIKKVYLNENNIEIKEL
ncbi:MAG: septum formation inhibitor [Campylobacterales bacterium]|nr:septum formation inhibitor [Campylobacterales bacterium]